MKKRTVILLTLLLCVSLFASQKNYPAESAEYVRVQTLLRLSGTQMPEMMAPVSADQLLKILNSIDVGSLNEQMKQYYVSTVKMIESPADYVAVNDDFGLEAHLLVSPQVFYNSSDETGYQDSLIPYRERLHMIDIDAGLKLGRYFYGEIDLDYTKTLPSYVNDTG